MIIPHVYDRSPMIIIFDCTDDSILQLLICVANMRFNQFQTRPAHSTSQVFILYYM